MNRQPDRDRQALHDASWPAARGAQALSALAERAGMPTTTFDEPPIQELNAEELTVRLGAAADRAGLQIDQVFVGLDELDTLLSHSAPALLRLAALEGAPLLAILGSKGQSIMALSPDRRVYRVHIAAIRAVVRQPFDAPIEAAVDRLLECLHLSPSIRPRARTKLMADRLQSVRFRGCWIVRLPPGAALADQAGALGLVRRGVVLLATYLAQYALFVLSWWLLGRAVLNGTLDRGWLLGWVLLLLTLIPLRLTATWTQGFTSISVAAALRRRLLRGAFRIDRQIIRSTGIGQLFGLVVEASAIDALALTGGVFAAFSILELAAAAVVLWLGAGAMAACLLIIWSGVAGYLAVRYFRRRQSWTHERLGMSEQLLERMLGHRTRLMQQSEPDRHHQEDEALARYLASSEQMDATALWLTAFIPRGWLVIATIILTPSFTGGASTSEVAITVGGMLLAYRALQRLAAGLSNLTGAVIAAQALAPLSQAAARHEHLPLPATVASSVGVTGPPSKNLAAHIRDVTFRYPSRNQSVLNACSLNVERHTRVLLEGPSGCGKTTFGAILAGLEVPESGLVLVGGLDRSALGAAGWRSRVIMAPQAHDNYLVSASLAFNLLMGRRWPAEQADLIKAETICRELGLEELLDRLPAGLNQLVGETGWQLSQGERTRVFLARALLQQPELLVLDESFSTLDADNLDRAARCVTTRASTVLAIAHL
jgi:ATP-binding cassette subfamily B protein